MALGAGSVGELPGAYSVPQPNLKQKGHHTTWRTHSYDCKVGRNAERICIDGKFHRRRVSRNIRTITEGNKFFKKDIEALKARQEAQQANQPPVPEPTDELQEYLSKK